MEILTYNAANAFVIELKGELDKFCRLDKLMQAIADGANAQAIIINIKEEALISSGVINFLFALKKANPELSQKIRLAKPNVQIQELFDLTRISEIYPVFDDAFTIAISQTIA